MPLLSLRTTISAVVGLAVAVVAVVTLAITLPSSLAALRAIGRSHAAVLLDGAEQRTMALFDGPLTAAEVMQNYSAKYAWEWPSDNATAYDAWALMHESAFLHSKLESASLLTYMADNSRFFFGPFIPAPALYVAQHHRATSITAAAWNFSAQGIANDVAFWYAANHSAVPRSHWAWAVPLALTKVRETLWDPLFMAATGGGEYTAILPILLVNFAGISQQYVPIVAPLRRRGDSAVFGFTISAMYISAISEFLRDVRGTPNTAAFALDNAGYLFASSLRESLPYEAESEVPLTAPLPHAGCTSTAATGGISTNNNVLMRCRAHASEYGYGPLRTMAGLTVGGAPFWRLDGRAVVHEASDGEYFYFASAHLALRVRHGLRIQLLLAMPEADVIGDVVRSRNVAIGVTCGVFVVVCGLLFALVTVLLAPLGGIAERMLLAAGLEDDDDDASVSAMAEVAELQEAYYAMNAELNRIRSFVPQSIRALRTRAQDDTDQIPTTETDTTMESRTRRGDLGMSMSVDDPNAPSQKKPRLSRHPSQETGGIRRSRGSKRSSQDAYVVAQEALPMKVSTVSVLVCNAAGFAAAVAASSKEEVTRAIGALTEVVLAEAAAQGGVLGAFHGDTFHVTFNAVKACAAHARRAAVAGLRIAQAAPGVGLRCGVRAGVATGKCLVGNAGTAEAKAFHVVGPAFTQAVVLERLGKLYGAPGGGAPGSAASCGPVVTSERTCADVATHVRFRYVDVVQLPGRKAPTLVAVLESVIDTDVVPGAAGGTASGSGDGEWLYIVNGHGAADEEGALVNEAFRAAAHGDGADALQLLHEAVGRQPASAPAVVEGYSSPPATHNTSSPTDGAEHRSCTSLAYAAERIRAIVETIPAPSVPPASEQAKSGQPHPPAPRPRGRDMGMFYAGAFGC